MERLSYPDRTMKEYTQTIQKLHFEDITNTTIYDCIKEMDINNKLKFSHYKCRIESNKKERLERGNIDIFFGLYTEHDNASYKIYTGTYDEDDPKEELIMSGKLLKNTLTFIVPLLYVAVAYNYIEIEVSVETYCLFSIVEANFRKYIACHTHRLNDFHYCGGVLTNLANHPEKKHTLPKLNTFPVISTFGIYTKIDNIYNKDDDYKREFGLDLNHDDKQTILNDFDILDYYITAKIKNEINIIKSYINTTLT